MLAAMGYERMKSFIVYYRVSTPKQGRSGLGLEAQQQAVTTYTTGRGEIVETFTEIESGKRHSNRPQLAAALDTCRKRKATLVIAKLDRLARNVHFISGLMESGVDFVAADVPEANRFTLHILAAVAEHEREMISQRTKEALAAAKRRGTRLGNPNPDEALRRGRATREQHIADHHARAMPVIKELHTEGRSLRQIAAEMDRRGIATPYGHQWTATGVRRMLLAR